MRLLLILFFLSLLYGCTRDKSTGYDVCLICQIQAGPVTSVTPSARSGEDSPKEVTDSNVARKKDKESKQ